MGNESLVDFAVKQVRKALQEEGPARAERVAADFERNVSLCKFKLIELAKEAHQ